MPDGTRFERKPSLSIFASYSAHASRPRRVCEPSSPHHSSRDRDSGHSCVQLVMDLKPLPIDRPQAFGYCGW